MRYKFIQEHRQEFSIKRMCHLLDVTRSGYYAWRPEKMGPRELENRVLVEQIHAEYKLSRKTYGSPRIQASLQRKGFVCGRHRVARLMRKEGIHPQKRQRWHPVTTQRQPGVIPAPNHLNQKFSADSANRKWVSDFTYIDTAEGWLFLAVVLDLFSRKVVGWAMAEQMNTALVKADGLTRTSNNGSASASFRSGQSIHQCCLSEQSGGCEHPDEHESCWKLL